MRKLVGIVCLGAGLLSASVTAAPSATALPLIAAEQTSEWCWKLPLNVDDATTQVRFEVDSTWHLVKGSTSEVTGTVALENPADQSSLHAELRLPVRNFDTDNESRDERLREVMAATSFPEVLVTISKLDGACGPDIAENAACEAALMSNISIHGVVRELRLPVTLTRAGDVVTAEGKVSFEWQSFGIEDPSILIARLDPVVTIFFKQSVPRIRCSA